ncbi:class I SAM-dependent methyltransferase [Micromonospora pisi]|uniref:class I SAM-dependent methyltransferase n=1 Tax=Micromonospora pisi TaxID=589240 RepID=UPI001FEBF776|nr:50S ribosomal protein L11 methyltransferase [Micromonospora pisi]
MTRRTADPLADLEGKVAGAESGGLDRLRLVEVPFVPEVRLHLAEDAIVWWARMEAEAGTVLPPPYWASAWPGGQALARYVLDNPDVVTGRRVLDLASGSGLAAIAAGLAGAATVAANDIDPYALAVIGMNARANDIQVRQAGGDLLDGDGAGVDLVLAGDVFYRRGLAQRMLPFLERAAARGARVLVGDPGRAYLPADRFQVLASYEGSVSDEVPNAEISRMDVLQLRLRD